MLDLQLTTPLQWPILIICGGGGCTIPLIRFIVQKYLGMVQVEGYFHFCSAHPGEG